MRVLPAPHGDQYSNEVQQRPSPLKGRDHTKPVWVDLRALFGSTGRWAEGIDLDKPAPGGLTRWLRCSDASWVGVVNVVVTMTDGSTRKFADQLIPSHALSPR
jgi:hypothetical protein